MRWVNASMAALLTPQPPPGTPPENEAGYYAAADRCAAASPWTV